MTDLRTTTLFKFCSAPGAILRGNSIFVTKSLDLNDPFEMRPGWDQRTNEHSQRQFHDREVRSRLIRGSPC